MSREETKEIKGLAICIMLGLHLFACPNWNVDNVMWKGLLLNHKFEMFSGEYGVICVSIFCFLSGYGIYKSYKPKSRFAFRHILGMYISYTLCLSFIIFFD